MKSAAQPARTARPERAQLLARARSERIEWFPASPGQRRLWLLDRLQPGGPAYNMPSAVRLRGPLDVAALAGGLGEIVRRHQPLRTAFAAVDGEPVQVVRPARAVALPVIDLSALPGEAREAHAGALATAEALRPFDLSAGRLLRATLLCLGPEDHVALLTLHHIAADEWSRSILTRELATLYRALSRGLPSRLPDLPIRYADYAAWQHRWLQSEACRTALSYWRSALAGDLPILDLPADRPRPPVPSYRGARESLRLPAPLTGRIRTLAGGAKATSFIVLLAAFKALLSRLTGQEDLAVGVPISNRTRLETEGLIGFFVNTLVVRTSLAGDPSFDDVLARVRGKVLGAFEHRELPFERLVEELNPDRDLSRSPLFQISFVMESVPPQEPPAAEGEDGGLRLARFGEGGVTAKLDLSLFVVEEAGSLLLTAELSRDLFDRTRIARLLRHYETLLEEATAGPERRLSNLPLLPEAERHQLLVEWNDTGEGRELPAAHSRIAAISAEEPGRLAVSGGGERWSFGRLDARANQLARLLRARGAGPGRFVAILMERRPEMVATLLAILKTGAAYLPLDPAYPPDRLAWLLEDAGASLVVTHPPLTGRLDTGRIPALCLEGERDAVDRQSAQSLDVAVASMDPAYLIYTSGSTGRPKGVLVPHGGLASYLAWCAERYVTPEGDGAPVHSSLGFDLTVTSLLGPLWAGQCVTLVHDGEGLDGLRAALSGGTRFSFLKLTPAHLELLGIWLAQGLLQARVGALVIGGEALRYEPLAPWRSVAPATRLINEYGPTETVVGCCVHEVLPDAPTGETVPIGRPIAATRLVAVDRALQPAPIGVPGELWIGGAGLAHGYLGRPDQTAERFVPDPFGKRPGERLYRTGDLVRRLPDGVLEFLGRIDQQVKIRGYRIEPGEVEAALVRRPGVREAAVVARQAEGGPELVAYVVAAGGGELDPERLRESLAAGLPAYMIPSEIVPLSELPLTSHGKVDRKALATLGVRSARESERVPPQSLVEHQLLEIWREVLGDRPMGVTDGFFDLGGHSLLAVRVLARVRKRFGCDLPLSVFFQGGTVRHLARAVLAEPRARWSPLVEIQAGGQRPRLFVVHPGGGGVLCYLPLVRRLGAGQPVFGLQADPGMPYMRFEEMAGAYVSALCAERTEGPRVLAGWSLGGSIAYEMAVQLADLGRPPDVLCILDTVAPDPARPPDEALLERAGLRDPMAFLDALEKALGLEIPVSAEELRPLPADEQLRLILGTARRVHAVPEELELADVERALEGFRRLMKLRRSWRPKSYGGRTVLLRSTDFEPWVPAHARRLREEDPTLGWHRLSARPVEVHALPGTHHSLMIEPHVAAVAERLGALLDPLGRREDS